MARKRVHEIAKEQGLTSKEVLAKLKAAGIEAKAAASSVEEADALAALGNGAAPAAGKAKAPAKEAKPKTAKAKDDKPATAEPKAAKPTEAAPKAAADGAAPAANDGEPPADDAPRPSAPRHLRRGGGGHAGPAADRSRPDPHQLRLHGQGNRRVARRRGTGGHQEADEPGGDGHPHPDALRRGARGARGGVRQEDRDRPRGRRRRGRADLRGRRGRSARAPARGDHHGPRRPRQDLAAGCDPPDRGRGGRKQRGQATRPRPPGLPPPAQRERPRDGRAPAR